MDRIGTAQRVTDKGVSRSVGKTPSGREPVYDFDHATKVVGQPIPMSRSQGRAPPAAETRAADRRGAGGGRLQAADIAALRKVGRSEANFTGRINGRYRANAGLCREQQDEATEQRGHDLWRFLSRHHHHHPPSAVIGPRLDGAIASPYFLSLFLVKSPLPLFLKPATPLGVRARSRVSSVRTCWQRLQRRARTPDTRDAVGAVQLSH
jgi:hypothetical protein